VGGDEGSADGERLAAAVAVARRRGDRALWLVCGLVALHAVVFAALSVARFRAFSAGRFDLGNMVQAVWSVANGGLFSTTEVSGAQFSRLGAHVDPILALFAAAWWVWPSPELLLVTQAVVVALGAVPAFWLARRHLRDDRLAVAAAAVYLLYPALQHAVLFDFHPVTLAAPLLMTCIWAADAGRWWWLGAAAALALITQEQVGLMLVGLAVWMWFARPAYRRPAVVLAGASALWVVLAVRVIIPAHALQGESPFLARYEGVGDGPAGIMLNLVTDPVDTVQLLATGDRLVYLVTLLAPLLFMPLLSPLIAAALPQFAINLLAGAGLDDGTGAANPIRTIEYHYAVVLVPFLIAAAILGLARLRDGRAGRLGRWLRPVTARSGLLAGVVVGAVVLAGVRGGPLPVWGWVPGGWQGSSLHTFTRDDSARALAEAVALVPPRAPVSATNDAGSHLSARRRIMLFPVLSGAEWVVVSDTARTRAVARDRPTLRPVTFTPVLRWLRQSPRWERVYDRAGVSVFRRVVPPGASAS
jgi:uncharacterized membrane protein